MADPTNVFALDDVAFMTSLQILPVVAPQAAIRKAIEKHYEAGQASMIEMMTEITADANVEVLEGEAEGAGVDVFELKESADEAPVVKLVNMVLVDAIRKGASDLHWEPYEKHFRIRFRFGGESISCSTPSMRNRMRKCFSYGSQCRSEAPLRIASTRTMFTSLTTGASSADSLSSKTSTPFPSVSPSRTSTFASAAISVSISFIDACPSS